MAFPPAPPAASASAKAWPTNNRRASTTGGYASGIVVTRLKGPDEQALAEVVLAELTQPFDQSDPSYFLPLMQRTETTLGRRPRCGALDKAYDAFYVYAYFHEAGGFAAVPWADRADHRKRFSPDGLPLCAAGLPMPRKSTFWQRSHCLISHEKARYGCPFSGEGDPASACPIHHPNAAKEEGCVTTLPTRIGNRVRHELDRENVDFARIYNQRSACERINKPGACPGHRASALAQRAFLSHRSRDAPEHAFSRLRWHDRP